MVGEERVLVTGASRVIVASIAELYRNQGYAVLTPSREELDFLDRNSVRAYCRAFEGPLHELENTAGINPINPVSDVKEFDLDQTLEVNLIAPFELMQGLFQRRYSKQDSSML